jgi:hypothetical protein
VVAALSDVRLFARGAIRKDRRRRHDREGGDEHQRRRNGAPKGHRCRSAEPGLTTVL